MTGQRALMQKLGRDLQGDEERVVAEYAAAEASGLVPRKSNTHSLGSLDYARRLLADGQRKGWLRDAAGVASVAHPRPVGADRRWEPATPSDRQASTSPTDSEPEWLREWFKSLGATESSEYLARIEQWRDAWRPQRVRVLLIAESHVAEHPGDRDVHVALPPGFASSAQMPSGFCRLVYCLGYGESAICDPPPVKNPGTWQFWDLFGAIASRLAPSITPEMPRRAEAGLMERLSWKTSVLETLSGFGVWLSDASIIGLHGPDGRRVSGSAYRRLVRESFERFVWPDVAEDDPSDVWIVGRGVGEALQGLPMIDPDKVISQPQDRHAERYRADRERMADILARELGQYA